MDAATGVKPDDAGGGAGDRTLVSVIVPAHNAARHLEGCFESIAQQEWPRDRMDVVVAVSERSTDGTAELARAALVRHGLQGTVVTHPIGTIPANLNAALRVAQGDVIVRVDVRTRIVPSHVPQIVRRLRDSEIAAVGGWEDAIAAGPGIVARGIARAHRNRWAMGGSRYRSPKGAAQTDTVYLGGYRREQLLQLAGWDERLVVNEDFDLHRRLAKLGRIWCEDSLRVDCLAPDHLSSMVGKFHGYGRWKVRYWQLRGERPSLRQVVSLVAPPALAVSVAIASPIISRTLPPSAQRAARRVTPAVMVTCALVALDAIGVRHRRAGLGERLVAAAANGLIAAAWWTGVVREWAFSRHHR